MYTYTYLFFRFYIIIFIFILIIAIYFDQILILKINKLLTSEMLAIEVLKLRTIRVIWYYCPR